MALLLLLDTSGNPGTAALAKDGRLLALRQNGSERDHAATLNNMVAAVLAEGESRLGEIDGVAVCNGPGSYTGLRIGLATAKGYCYAGNKPLLLQSRLALLAGQHQHDHPRAEVSIALLKARNAEYFAAAYSRTGEELLAPQHLFEADLNRFLEQTGGRPLLVSTDIPEFFSAKEQIQLESVYSANIDPDYWLKVADKQFQRADFAPLHLAEPFYLKAAYTTVKIN